MNDTKPLKLYIWAEPYPVSYGSSLLIVAATDLRSAKSLAKKGTAWKYGEHSEGEAEDWMSKIELGKPTRVVSLPAAEWHLWEE